MLSRSVFRPFIGGVNDLAQIFGGRGITQSGMGSHIEHVSTARCPRDVCLNVF